MLSQLIPVFIITFSVFILFFIFMSISFFVKKVPLKGSCGGVATLMGDKNCQFCGDDPNKCAEINSEEDNNVSDSSMSDKASELGKSIV